jgi:hypothetical protein
MSHKQTAIQKYLGLLFTAIVTSVQSQTIQWSLITEKNIFGSTAHFLAVQFKRINFIYFTLFLHKMKRNENIQ